MTKVGKRIANPISGDSFHFLQTAQETNVGARFEVTGEGVLSLSLSFDLEEVEKSLQEKSTF